MDILYRKVLIYYQLTHIISECIFLLGNTPKIGKISKGNKIGGKLSEWFSSRIIGVEVACGPINTTFIYTTDNLQSGGANTLVSHYL
jgi:hypothetical protein